MYCYRSTVTTTKGDALPGWQVECVQNSDLTTPVTIYADESLTPISSVSGVSNKATADENGNFYFFVEDGLYGLRYYDSAGVYQRTDRYISMYGIAAAERLTGTRIYYVRADGSDSNNGRTDSSSGAFLTIQKAIDTAYGLDLNGNVAIIQVGPGTYTGSVSIYNSLTGANDDQPLRIIGDEVTPSNVVISTTGANAINVGNNAYVLLAGLTIQTATSGIGISAFTNAMVEHRNLRFGNCANEMILTQHHATVRALGTTTVAGSAQYFCHATKRSIIDFAGKTIAFSGSPTFSTYLWGINDASVNLDSGTITGTPTGPILVHKNGSLNASSLTGSYLGGTAPVVTDEGIVAVQDLLETRNLYVRTDGNDANDGLANTAARAFKTIGAAVNYLSKLSYNPLWWTTTLDSGFTINVASGTYSETVNLRDVRAVGATILGNEITPANVIVAGVTDGFAAIGLNTKWYIRGVKISAASGSALRLEQGSQISFRAVDFGNCTSAHIFTQTKSVAIAEGNYSITSNAAWHKIARTGSAIVTSDRTVTLTGTPNFSQSYALADDTALIRAVSMTFSGSATGKRYDVATNGVINTNGGGATYLPGNSAGTTATGGQYA
jgi:hypothetical protein